jgi:EPS-associated MarR family transcriptional regulator
MAKDKTAQQREDLHFKVLRLLESRPDIPQREIGKEVGVSLGTVNYCVKALIDKGHIMIANFKASKNKLSYVYVLTPDGITHRGRLAARFIERKVVQYEAMRAELDQLRSEFLEDSPNFPHN